MIEPIQAESGVPTTTVGTWDPHANQVAYDLANYTSDTADGDLIDEAAQHVAERVDRIAANQDQCR